MVCIRENKIDLAVLYCRLDLFKTQGDNFKRIFGKLLIEIVGCGVPALQSIFDTLIR